MDLVDFSLGLIFSRGRFWKLNFLLGVNEESVLLDSPGAGKGRAGLGGWGVAMVGQGRENHTGLQGR